MTDEYLYFLKAINKAEDVLTLNKLRDEINGHFCLDTRAKEVLTKMIVKKIKFGKGKSQKISR